MNLREVELFGTLMRVGTTIETARVLGISQAGVSAQLKRLKAHIGFRLFHRNGNRLEPTAEAHRVFQETTPIFVAYAQVLGLLDDLAVRAEAPVSVSATPAVVEGFLAPHLVAAGFTEWRKRLRLLVTDPELDVRNGQADLGIQMAVPPKIEFHSYRLAPVPMYAVCKTDSPLASRISLKIADIQNNHFVAYNPVSAPMGQAICGAFQSQGKLYDPACIVPFSSTVCQMVEACGGVDIIDELTVKHLQRPSLTVVPLAD